MTLGPFPPIQRILWLLGIGWGLTVLMPATAADPPDPQVPFLPDFLRKDLERQGLNNRSDAAVAAGVKWIVQQQAKDGHWEADPKNDIAGTAWGVLALQGAGQFNKSKRPYAPQLEAGLKYLLLHQNKDGSFSKDLVADGLATWAICECYGTSADPFLKGPAQRALQRVVQAQNPDGGWGSAPGKASDLSSSGWLLLGMRSGNRAGLAVPKENLAALSKYLDRHAFKDGSRYSLTPGGQPTPEASAIGLFGRCLLFGSKDPAVSKGVDELRKNPPPKHLENGTYGLFTALLMRQVGDRDLEAWTAWYGQLRDGLIAQQDAGLQEPASKGSWSPEKDPSGKSGGRLQTTAVRVLALEACYRFLTVSGRDFSRKD